MTISRELLGLMAVVAILTFWVVKDEKNPWKKARKILITAVISTLVGIPITNLAGDLFGEEPEGKGEWGKWSEWTSEPAYESSTREVETREITTGYKMVVFVTQENIAPKYYRNFRDFSINKDFEYYGVRESYGEKYFKVQVSPEQISSAKTYNPEEFIPNHDTTYVGGYNKSSKTAYVMPIALDNQGRYYPLFIEEEMTETQYRYRDKLI